MTLHGVSLVASPGLNSDLKQQSFIPVLGLAGILEYHCARCGPIYQTLKWLLQHLHALNKIVGNSSVSGLHPPTTVFMSVGSVL